MPSGLWEPGAAAVKLRPVLRLLVVWVLNAIALLAVAYLMPSVQVRSFGTALGAARLISGFDVPGLWPAILAAVLYSIVSWLLSALILKDE